MDYLCKEVNGILNSGREICTGRYDHTQEFNPVNSCNSGKDSTNAQKLTTMVHCRKAMQETVEPIFDVFTRMRVTELTFESSIHPLTCR